MMTDGGRGRIWIKVRAKKRARKILKIRGVFEGGVIWGHVLEFLNSVRVPKFLVLPNKCSANNTRVTASKMKMDHGSTDPYGSGRRRISAQRAQKINVFMLFYFGGCRAPFGRSQ